MVLLRVEATDVEDDERIGRKTELPADLRAVRRGRIEAGGTDAVVDHAAPRILAPVFSPIRGQRRGAHSQDEGRVTIDPASRNQSAEAALQRPIARIDRRPEVRDSTRYAHLRC